MMRYDAFISYSHSTDRELARSLESHLRMFGRKWHQLRRLHIYRDETNLAAEPRLWPAIESAVNSSRFLILLASPRSAGSKWVPREVKAAIAQHGADAVIVVQTEGVLPWTDGIAESELADRADSAISPEIFATLDDAGLEPLVVDLRRFRDSQQRQIEKTDYLSSVATIAAKILNTTKDAIWGDYYRAQRARFAFVGAIACVLLGLLIVIGVVLSSERVQRNLAESNFREANVQRKAASEQRDAAVTARDSLARQLAATWFARAEDSAGRDRLGAFALAARAVAEAPEGDSAAQLYMSREMHLLSSLPDAVINLPVEEVIASTYFDRSRSTVSLETPDGRVRVFQLRDAHALHVPASVNDAGVVRPPDFDEQGNVDTYIRWFHPEPDPDERGTYALHVRWNPRSGEVLTPVDDGHISPDDLDWTVFNSSYKEESQAQDVSDGTPEQPLTPAKAVATARTSYWRRLLGSPTGWASGGAFALTADADGSVFLWPTEQRRSLVNILRIGNNLKSAQLLGNRLITLDKNNKLSAKDASTGTQIWAQGFPVSGGMRTSADGSLTFVEGGSGDAVFRTSDGNRIPMDDHRSSDQYHLLGTSITSTGTVLYAYRYSWEAGNDLLFEWNAPPKTNQTSECKGFSLTAKPNEFLGFLREGQYALAGSDTAFRMSNLCPEATLAKFFFGRVGSMTTSDAIQLLLNAVAVVSEKGSRRIAMTIRGGAQLTLDGTGGHVGELRLASDGSTIRSAKSLSCQSGQLVALSGDGKWVASANGNRLCIWDSRTGYTVTNDLRYSGEALDLAFTDDGLQLKLVSSDGLLLTIAVAPRKISRPKWLELVAAAMSGRGVASDGSTYRLPQTQVREARRQLEEGLVHEDPANQLVRLLKERLESAGTASLTP